ncbi:hypothetical protein [Phytoactinopolyspora halotolerans]|uniref:Uncharacterized protein n=1 Tax=Phytoactinopolyspora halotolerans TaxID=1981512 RepID=A0A6L9SEZ0_9ACTN|nr:hypothetical protein [Phytoactinopolyspora halotolerans]NEE03806.1 hypothetical protein [Phytoactinopolyspora halotolerans]
MHETGARDADIPLEDLEGMLESRDRFLLAEAMAAEQRGELDRALDYVQHMSVLPEGRWASQLAEMIEIGEHAEPWHWARFAVAAAGRWITSMPMPLVARAQREIGAAAEGAAGSPVPEYPGWVAGRAALSSAIADFMLFDNLMIEVFLVQVAPSLAEGAGGGRSWAMTPGRVYELAGADGLELHLRDRADGSEQTARHLSEMVGLSRGDLVYGRLVEIPGDPGRIFAAPPIAIDEVAAQRLGRITDTDDLLEDEPVDARCANLGAAVRSGNRYRRAEAVSKEEPASTVRAFERRPS